MIILEENFKWHLEAFASELFIYNLQLWICAVLGSAIGFLMLKYHY